MLKQILNVFLLIIITTVGGLSSAVAQSPFSSSDKSSSPIEISAEESLEWLQEKKQYVANGSVIVTQDEMTLTADKLVADYDDNQGGSLNITFLTATGNVVLKNLDMFSGKVGFVEIPKNRAIDVDDKFDYKLVRLLTKK